MVTLSPPLLSASGLETELRGTSGLSLCIFTTCSSEINYPWDDSQYWLYNYAVALHWLALRGACRDDGLCPGSASSCGKCQSLQAAFETAPVEVAVSSLGGTLAQVQTACLPAPAPWKGPFPRAVAEQAGCLEEQAQQRFHRPGAAPLPCAVQGPGSLLWSPARRAPGRAGACNSPTHTEGPCLSLW